MPKSFHDLEVWQRSMDLALLIYDVTSDFPKHELYGLTSQMRRAAVSISSNIAEESARGTRRDFRQFVLTARGSNAELQTQIMLATRLGYSDRGKLDEALFTCQRIGRMLHGLSDYLKRAPNSTHIPPTT